MAKPTSPPGPVRTAPGYADFNSYGLIAQELIKKYPDAHSTIAPRSLAGKIGSLDQGQRTWWANHPASAIGLAELLQVSREDLGLHEQALNRHMFVLEAFTELPPLDLKHGRPWHLASAQLASSQRDPTERSIPTLEHWLAPAQWIQRPPYDMDWLYVEDDLEREILSGSLAAAGHFEVVHAETLADAGSRLQVQKPVIISVRGDGGDADMAALAHRPENAGLLIIAPFMLPTRKETSSAEYFGWEQRSSNRQERNRFQFDLPGRSATLKRWTWTLLPDWRIQLLKLVDAHISQHNVDSLYSEQRITDWLEAFDPSGVWFCTTTDLLHLCRMGHYRGTKLPGTSDVNAGQQFAMSLPQKEMPFSGMQLTQLAKLRWQRGDLPWKGALPLETWHALAPAGMTTAIREALNEIALAQNEPARLQAAAQLAMRLEASNPEWLLASGLLKQERRGFFEFQHRALANLAVRDYLIHQITQETVDTWAMTCFEEQRRSMLDAALDAVSLADLINVTEKLDLITQDSAMNIGASEALFMAVARKIAKGEEFPSSYIAALAPLAQCVVGRLDFTEGEWSLPKPWSRPSASQDEQIEWVSACWAWSLLPEIGMTISEKWLFPGWCMSLGEAPSWLSSLWPDSNCKQLPHAWTNFFSIADEWVKDLSQPLVDAPRLLKIALLGKAARGAWSAEPSWWQDLTDFVHEAWIFESLLKRINFNNPDGAVRLWPSFLLSERTSSDDLARYSPVRRWLLEQLNPTNGLNSLTHDDLLYLAKIPESLPPEFRAPLLSSLMTAISEMEYWEQLPFLQRFGPSAAPSLVSYLQNDSMVDAAIECLWDWQPETAVALLRKKTPLSATTLGGLALSCPANHLTAAIELLLNEPTLLDASTRIWWARGHLSKSGVHSRQLFEIITNLPSEAS